MQHPLVFDEPDAALDRLRAVCLALPEAVEVLAWGRPTFRAGKRIFVTAGASMDRPHSMVFKPDPEERRALVQDDRFFIPPYYGPAGWLAIDFDSPNTDWVELAELAETSYRQVALKRQLVQLQSRRADSARGGSEKLL
ncbi:MmcQ/YjbR family DNA-binding protein [Cryobacterium sp. 1639]|uniref:MmcQ/YjbR family DNA-binding protein n=1 Tax=Cryobacterium inferilacus TaxID=2866629 RepID=UPI001C73B968|nr:MmcQ/YjbR family DNA-binding protein [Cryobacterium sp. 1639]MBX0301918.1 MmcQ/YjbR family DNA-binding protein [Cryobacterium sp. 1639]